MGKETTIEATDSPVVFRTDEQAGTRRPQHFCSIVILPAVGFNSIEESAATERIAIAVDVATRSARILEFLLVDIGKQLRLTGRHFRVGVHICYQRTEPVRGNLHIAIQQHIIFGFHLFQRTVVAFCKPVVLVEDYGLYLGITSVQECQRVVCRSIISYDDRCFVA